MQSADRQGTLSRSSLPEIPPTSHEADALAVAICHALMPPLARMAS